MRHWYIYIILYAVIGVFGLSPFRGNDIAKLSPVEAVWLEVEQGSVRIETDGGDYEILLYHHTINAELYTASPAPDVEQLLEDAFAANGVHFEKEEAFWIQEEQRYQTVYEFSYHEKRRA